MPRRSASSRRRRGGFHQLERAGSVDHHAGGKRSHLGLAAAVLGPGVDGDRRLDQVDERIEVGVGGAAVQLPVVVCWLPALTPWLRRTSRSVLTFCCCGGVAELLVAELGEERLTQRAIANVASASEQDR